MVPMVERQEISAIQVSAFRMCLAFLKRVLGLSLVLVSKTDMLANQVATLGGEKTEEEILTGKRQLGQH